ncbi:flagellar biosynthesis anti-sigma factor FlgM [Bacillus sp. MUM 13]|uniref:flagellar biosynthesis anti-sigma factor FlgM n=1 Tax=Bacillus sp. MUM 13 TaxID=1678001 RepID=UPI0008F5A24C|nr:flagellar biosynthesis anti-sigma factor FlgM [Bacillus sp. MUM 13]OIK11432.1 flagellar biosynthesis anti-sigma factor FlgM [Bacillus sp. MUM 13]
MKINQTFGASGVNPYNRQANKIDQTKPAVKLSDKVEISSTAKELQQTSQIPAQRQAKVEELKLQVQNGTYKLNAQETAKSILNHFKK